MKKLFLILSLILLSITGFAQKHTSDHYDYAIRQAFKENRWDAGKYMLDEAEPYYGKLSIFYELKGWYYYHLKNYTVARYNLSNALQEDENNTNARTILSKVEEETGHYSAAICYINELLQKNPYNKSLWIRKINMYKKLGNTTEADKLAKRLAEIYPNDEAVKALFNDEYTAKLKESKQNGDVRTQISVAKDLVSVNPTAENYLAYTNALLNGGYLSDALDVSAEGASRTKSYQLIKKHCDILCEQGKYTEAINYINNNFGSNAAARKLKDDIENEQARNATQYDPYTMNQKLYYKTHDNDAFNYIVNTALSRGYYYDAIDFINEYKKIHKNVSTTILYKEYTAYNRLGNNAKATEILEKIKEQDNKAVTEELCNAYYKQGNDFLSNNDYLNATPKFEYIVKNSIDNELVKSSKDKLYTCYLNTNKLDNALKVVDNNDYRRKATIYELKGDYNTALSYALRCDTLLYTDISIKYIKKLIDEKEYITAYNQSKEALSIADAPELYMYAISSGTKLNKDVSPYIITGIEKYPKDDYFINQYCGLMNREALALYKDKSYDDALSKVNEGLEYNEEDKDLINTKGLIYEKLKQYELSYEYQKSYNPGILEAYEFRKKMQGMKSKGYNNEFDIYYQYRRNEDDDAHKSLAGIAYSRVIKRHTINPFLNYCARNGNKMTALQIGASYDYTFKHDIDLGVMFAYGTNYMFPRYDAKISLLAGLPKDWTINGHFEYKRIDNYEDSVTTFSSNVYNVGLGFAKNWDQVSLSYKLDGFMISKKFYFNNLIRCDYMPLEGNKTKLFIAAGFGTAPEVTITENLMPSSINKINTFVSGGGSYWINEHLGFGIDGSWYTLYNEGETTKYINYFYVTASSYIRF